MPALGKKIEVQILPGVMPINDGTNLESLAYTNADKVRFQHGKLRKLKGWERLISNNNQILKGAARTMFNYIPSDGIERTIIGTSDRLYVYESGLLINITPLNTTNIPINNSLSTVYYTDPLYSVTTTQDSDIVTFNVTNVFLNINDQVTVSGVVGAVGGIPSGDLNDTFFVIGIPSSNSFQVKVSTTATSTANGGGTTIRIATSQLIVNLSGHGLTKGDRIKISGSTDVANILAASINIEHIVENVISSSYFIINTETIATSLVTNGGGGAINLQKQIAGGPVDFSFGFGYGGGLYGSGLYGIGKQFTNGFVSPRIWSVDLYGDNIVLTPGSQSMVYLWQNDPSVAPTVLTNAPTAVNWVFQSRGMVCVLGPNGVYNIMQSSNIGDATDWTPSPSSTASVVAVPGAGPFISQAPARNVDLLFTTSQVYEMRYVNLPFIWQIDKLVSTDGIIGPRAKVNLEDVLFWMGNADFYAYDGYTVNTLPNNTVKRFVFDNINQAQSYKTFASLSPAFNEIWWIYPSGNSKEPNTYVIFNYKEQHWTIGTIDRTSAIEPALSSADVLMTQTEILRTINLSNDSLSTVWYTLTSNPIATTNGSASIVITISNHHLNVGDSIQISGAANTNGILAANINGLRTIITVTVSTVTVAAGSNATSTGSGGGASITIGTQLISVANPGNSFVTGDIVTLNDFEALDTFVADDINTNFSVRYFDANTFEVSIANNYSTQSITGGGNDGQINYIKDGVIYEHESNYNDYDVDTNEIVPLQCFAETNYTQIGEGDLNMLIYSVIPDSNQIGELNLNVYTKPYPQSNIEVIKGPFQINPTTQKVDVMSVGRQRKYRIYSNQLDQNFVVGKWYEQITPTTPI